MVGTDPKTGGPIERHASDDEPFCALAFKLQTDPFVGALTFFRVYSGTITAGSYVYNSTTGTKERIGRIVRLQADKREEVEKVFPYLVFYKDDIPESVNYHELPVLLLKEIQKLNKRIQALEERS